MRVASILHKEDGVINAPAMIGSTRPPRYALLRAAALAIATLAMGVAVSGAVARATVLAWAVAAMALITFGATYHLKH